MQDISLHILDLIENSCQAESDLIKIEIIMDKNEDKLIIKIADNGIGMDQETLENSQNPFFTTKKSRKKKVGLGIPLFKQNAEHCNGKFIIKSKKNKGTTVIAEFQLSHIDRMPLGNLADTFINSIIAHPNIDFEIHLRYKSKETTEFYLSTKEIKEALGDDIPITHPLVYEYLKENFEEGIKKTYMEEL